MKNILFYFLTIIANSIVFSQNITGLVLDKDNNPISEVNITIPNTGIGTISNNEGKFTLKIPKKHQKELIVFSHLGFESKNVSISDFKENIKIQLKRKIIELDEIYITKKDKLTSNEIVKKAFNNYTKNFPTEEYLTKGFLRYTEKTEKEYKWLIESTLGLYDPGITKTSDNIKLNIKEVRKSFDNRVLDTMQQYILYLTSDKKMRLKRAVKFARSSDYKKVSKQELKNAIIFNDNNPNLRFSSNLKKIFSRVNVLRNYNQEDAIFTNKTMFKKHDFKFDTILDYNGDDVYKIKITPKKSLVKLNKKIKKYLLPFGWIYIRANDFAIFEFDYTLINSKKSQIITNLSNSKIHSSLKIKFTEFNGKMYPKHLVYKAPKWNRLSDAFRTMHNTVEDKDIHYFSTLEVLFTEIITDKKKINLSLQKKWNDNLFESRPYNAEFWKNYNILLENKVQGKMRQDLEKKVKLKQQYQQN